MPSNHSAPPASTKPPASVPPKKKLPTISLEDYVNSIDPTIVLLEGHKYVCAACHEKINFCCRCPKPDFCDKCNERLDDVRGKLHRGELTY